MDEMQPAQQFEHVKKHWWMIDLRCEGVKLGLTDEQVSNIRNCICAWVESDNFDSIDEAVRYCWDEGIELNMPPTLIYFIAETATKRLQRDERLPKHYRTVNNQRKSSIRENTLLIMFELKYFCGIDDLDELSLLGAAARYKALPEEPPMRASTLRSYFPRWEKESGTYIQLQLKKHPNGWDKNLIDRHLKSLAEVELPEEAKRLR